MKQQQSPSNNDIKTSLIPYTFWTHCSSQMTHHLEGWKGTKKGLHWTVNQTGKSQITTNFLTDGNLGKVLRIWSFW